MYGEIDRRLITKVSATMHALITAQRFGATNLVRRALARPQGAFIFLHAIRFPEQLRQPRDVDGDPSERRRRIGPVGSTAA
jgi:hypothetical protein